MKKKRHVPARKNYPAAGQFEVNPAARPIRDACLEVIAVLHGLAQSTVDDPTAAYARLEQLNGRLVELGCWVNMCTHLEQTAYRDPLVMARYVAGQLLQQISRHVVSITEVVPIIQEHAQIQSGPFTAFITRGSELPAPVRSFIVNEQVLREMCYFLDTKLPQV